MFTPHIPDFSGKSLSSEGSWPAGTAVCQDTPREADKRRPVPSVWGNLSGGGGIEGSHPRSATPPLNDSPPPLSRPRSNPGLPAGGGRGVGRWGGAGEALLSQIIGIPPPLGILGSGPPPFGGRPYLHGEAAPFGGGP